MGSSRRRAPVGTGFRLPTEAEWSRAARYPEGGPLKYPWGAALPVRPRSGNYADESARPVVGVVLQGYDDRYPVSAPVGSFPPNALGFFDLGGNVAEWVHDVYSIPPADAPLERDPLGPPPGELHVVLGSSYLQGTVTELRLSYRDYATKARPDVGFRVARYARVGEWRESEDEHADPPGFARAAGAPRAGRLRSRAQVHRGAPRQEAPAAEASPAAPPATPPGPDPLLEFVPKEHVPADSAVSFPVDI